MNELALFAGAGGGILGGKLLGWKTVCAVEIEEYCRRILMQRQDDGILAPFPIWDDVRTFDGKPWRGVVDVVSGGFPCQDISAAGQGAGISGERSGLWSEMARIIGEVRPRFAFVENSPMLVGRGLTRVLSDLAAMGYDARWGVLGAHHATAPHKRDRIWIVANDTQHGWREGREGRPDTSGAREREQPLSTVANPELLKRPQPVQVGCGEGMEQSTASERGQGAGEVARRRGVLADASRDEQGREKQRPERERAGEGGESTRGEIEWWKSEPALGRVAHGVADRVDRLKALGNGQVPAVVAIAWEILGENK
jgi:DNA (cytosine-5)-methyltransferase 1